MDTLKFVVLGDTHFCMRELRGKYEGNCSLAELPDYVRYSDMVDNVLKPMFERVKAFKPEFVISTGDFVEGGMSEDREKTYKEMEAGWEFMKTLDCPFLIAKGTHEGSGEGNPGAEAYREIVMPEIREQTGLILDKEYFRFDRGDCSFFLLDYLRYTPGRGQDKWLEDGLRDASANSRRIFIVAHPPLYNWGRHFFNEPEFINRIIELCHKYPVDVYFCGHTHNQCVSFHETAENGSGFLQLMGSSVGYPNIGVIALHDYHRLAEFSDKDNYIWGIHEDSAPGFYFVEIDDTTMKIKWISSTGDEAALAQKRRSEPTDVVLPEYKKYRRILSQNDVEKIKEARLHIYGLHSDIEDSELFFNGISLGCLPKNGSYAARRYFMLSDDALNTIRPENIIDIKMPSKGDFVIGSVSLELIFYDNTVVRSKVARELLTAGERWKNFPQPRSVTKVHNGEKITFTLTFKS